MIKNTNNKLSSIGRLVKLSPERSTYLYDLCIAPNGFTTFKLNKFITGDNKGIFLILGNFLFCPKQYQKWRPYLNPSESIVFFDGKIYMMDTFYTVYIDEKTT